MLFDQRPTPEEEARQRVEDRAREIWVARELGFPRFVRQTWGDGTQLARDATRLQAARELGYLPPAPPPTATSGIIAPPHKTTAQPPAGATSNPSHSGQ